MFELHCCQLAENMETAVSKKRNRKKSRTAQESDEMNFIELDIEPAKKTKLSTQEEGEQRTTATALINSSGNNNTRDSTKNSNTSTKTNSSSTSSNNNSSTKTATQGQQPNRTVGNNPDSSSTSLHKQENKPSAKKKANARSDTEKKEKSTKREELKRQKNAEIEAGKTQAALFFRNKITENIANQSASLSQPLKAPNHQSTPILPQSRPPSQIVLNDDDSMLISPSHSVTTLGQTGSLIRETLNNIDIGDDISEHSNLESSGFNETFDCKELSDVEPEIMVPCKHCSQLVNELRAEIAALKKRQLPGEWISVNVVTAAKWWLNAMHA